MCEDLEEQPYKEQHTHTHTKKKMKKRNEKRIGVGSVAPCCHLPFSFSFFHAKKDYK